MSSTVENRVLIFNFDNSNFEHNVAQSMGTLEKLKSALNFDGSNAFKGFDKAVKGLSFDGISSSVDFLEKRFSTLGIVGMRVIENMTDSAMRFATKGIRFLTDGIVKGGIKRAMDIENAHFQLQGLLKDEAKVQAVMQAANDSVDGTAYAYNDAAKAAASFAATGLQTGGQMETALRALAGTAAMTNSDYASLADIFTTVAGNGRLMGMQLNQLSYRGMNAAATLRDFFNGINDGSIQASDSVTAAVKSMTKGMQITEGDIREFVHDGELSFDIFAEAMDNAFGEHAKEANKTFNGALSNMKAALGRIGEMFVSPLIVQEGPLVRLFNTLREKINEVKANSVDLAAIFVRNVTKMADGLSKTIAKINFEKVFEGIYNIVYTIKHIAQGIGSILKPIGQAFLDIFPPSSALNNFINITFELRKLTSNLKLSNAASQNLRDTFAGLFSVSHAVGTVIATVIKSLMPLSYTSETVAGTILNGVLAITGALGRCLQSLSAGIEYFSPFISSVLTPIANAMRTIVSLGVKLASSAFSGLKGWFEEFRSSPAYIKFLYKFREAAHEVFDFLKEKAEGLSQKLRELDKITLNDVIGALKKFKNAISDVIFGKLPNFFKSGLFSFGNLKEQFVNLLNEGFNEPLKQTGKSLSDHASTFISYFGKIGKAINENIGLGEIFTMVWGGMFAVSMHKTGKLIDNFISMIGSFKHPIEGIGKLFKGIGEVIKEIASSLKRLSKSMAFDFYANGILKMGVAIGIIAGSIYALAQVKNKGDLATAVGVIAGVMAALTAISIIVSKFGGSGFSWTFKDGLKGTMNSILSIAIAIGILAAALKLIGTMNADELAQSMDTVFSLIGLMTVSGIALSKLGGSAMPKAGAAFVGMAIAVGLMVGALKELNRIKFTNPTATIIALAGIIGALTALSWATKLMTTGEGASTWKNGFGMTGIAASVYIMAKAMKAITDIDMTGVKENIEAFALVFGSLIGMMIAANFAGEYSARAGAGILGMSLSLIAIAAAVKMLSKMDKADIQSAMETISEIFLLFGLVTMMSGLAGQGAARAGVMILLMSGALMLLVPTIGALATMGRENPEGLRRGVTALAVIFEAFGIMAALSSFTATTKVGPLVALAVIMGELIAALGGLAMIPVERLESARNALMAVMFAFSAMQFTSGFTSENTAKGILSMVVMIGAVAALGAVLYQLSDLDGNTTLKNAISLSGVMTVMTGCMVVLSKLKPLSGVAIGQLAAIGGIVAGIALIFKMMDALDIKVSLKAATGLSEVLLAMTAATAVLSLLGKGGAGTIKAAAVGVAGLATVVGGIALLIGLLGAAFKGLEHFHYEDVIEKGVMMFEKVGNALGRLVGGSVAGFQTALNNGQMESMMDGMETFVERMSSLDPDSVKMAKSITGMMADLGEYKLGDAIGSMFGKSNDPETIKTQMAAIGEGLSAFGESISGFKYDSTKMDQITECMGKLSGLIKSMDKSGGAKGLIFGDKVTTFGEIIAQLIPLAKGLAWLSTVTSHEDFDLTGLDNVYAMFERLNTIIQSMEKFGVWQFLSGSKLLAFGTLIEMLPNMASKLSSYSDNISGFDATTVDASAGSLQKLVKAVAGIFSGGGLKGGLKGDKIAGLEGFVENIGKLGFGLRMYMMAINGISDFSMVPDSAKALGSLVKAVSGIFSAGGAMANLKGDKAGGLVALSSNLGRLGMGLRMYMLGISGITDFSNVGPSVTALTQLMDFMNKASNFNVSEFMSSSGLVHGQNFRGLDKTGSSMEGFAKNLERLGQAMGNYATSMQGTDFDPSQLMSAVSALNEFANLSAKMQLYSDKMGDNIFQGLADSLPVIGSALKELAMAVPDVEKFTSTADALEVMKTSFDGLSTVDVGNINGITTALNELATMSFDTFSTSLSNMSTTMSQTMMSMTTNVTLGAIGIVAALKTMASQMNEAVSSGINMVAAKVTTMMILVTAAVRNGAAGMSAAMGQAMMAMATAASTGGSMVVAAIRGMMTQALAVISGFNSLFKAAGLALAVALSGGFKAGAALISTAARLAARAGATAASSASSLFHAAGVMCGIGFARGIASQAAAAYMAGYGIGQAGVKGAKAGAQVQSPSRAFMQVGFYCVEGFVKGITNNEYRAFDSSEGMAKGVVSTFCDILKINSPSIVMNEMGHYVVEGLADGITEDMSAEDAMAKKAENIVNAFKTKIDELDLDITTAELLNKQWSLINKNADEKEAKEQEAKFLEEKIGYQEKIVKLAEDEWEQTKANLEDTEKIQEAYNKFLTEQNELLELRNELEEVYATIKNNNYKSDREQKLLFDTWNKKYLEELKAARELVEMGWITSEEADRMAKESAERYTGVLFENLFPGQEDVKWRGGQITEAYAEGMTEKKDSIEDAASDISNAAVVASGEMENEMYAAGQNLGQALANGITSKMDTVAAAASALATVAKGTTEKDLEINSPSKVFMRIGGYLSEGLALGITEASGKVINSLSGLSGRIGRAIESDSNFTPSITPVIDTSRLDTANASLMPTFNSMFTVPNNEWNYKMYEVQKDFISSNERVVSAVRDLRDDLNTIYSENNGEVSLYVDSKKLASTIAKPMNRQLSVLSKRGAY